MIKKTILITLAFLVASAGIMPLPQAHCEVSLAWKSVSATSAVVYDPLRRQILFSKTPHLKRHPASTTKVMTALVVLDKLKLDQKITVRKDTSSISTTKIYVRPGETFRVRDLLKALLISSANDVAAVFAHHISGSDRAFSRLMNRKAQRIGARNTRFLNPHGLPAYGQYSTSYDLALIMREASKYPFIMQTLAMKTTTIRSVQGRRFYLKNHNKMLWRDRRPIIGKTGFTRRALHCFVGEIRSRDRKMLVAIMGSIRPWKDLKILLDLYSRSSVKKAEDPVLLNKKHWTRDRFRRFEQALRRAGFNPGTIDGVVTAQSIQAIRAFQRSRRIPQTGFIGPLTTNALKKFT